MKILIATGNEGKKKEMLEVLGKLEGVEWLSLRDFPEVPEPEETGTTFEANAILKAKYFADQFQIPTLGEDSGLILDAFPEKFGVRTRREIPVTDDEEWLRLFLELLEGEPNRKATFYSCMGYYDSATGLTHTVTGTCEGDITQAPETTPEEGIPVSAVFKATGEKLVYSAMSKDEKNAISHRGGSAHGMMEFLKKRIAQKEA